MNRLDEIRAANPLLGIALYAYDPTEPVTLEVLTPDGRNFTFKGATVAEAIEAAFPSAPVSEKPTDTKPQPDIFE